MMENTKELSVNLKLESWRANVWQEKLKIGAWEQMKENMQKQFLPADW